MLALSLLDSEIDQFGEVKGFVQRNEIDTIRFPLVFILDLQCERLDTAVIDTKHPEVRIPRIEYQSINTLLQHPWLVPKRNNDID